MNAHEPINDLLMTILVYMACGILSAMFIAAVAVLIKGKKSDG